MRALSLEQANAIIDASLTKARELGCKPLSVVILDAGGRVKAFQKQDGAALLRFEISYGKAFGALALGRSSRLVLEKAKDKPLFIEYMSRLSDGPIFPEGGGQLIRDEHAEVIGSIGITGDVNNIDDEVAIAGIHATGLKTCEDFDDSHRV